MNPTSAITACVLFAVSMSLGCGGSSSGAGGAGGSALERETSYTLTCTIGMLALEIPVDLRFSLDRPLAADGESELTIDATVVFDEPTSRSLIEAGASKIDIVSIDVAVRALGAIPSSIATSFGAAPINDFDLEIDTDDNGMGGPHRLELDTATNTVSVIPGVQQVELGLNLNQVSMVLGNFVIPTDCFDPTLVGAPATYSVGP